MSTSVADEAGKMETVSEQAATVLSVWYLSTVAAAMSDQVAMLQSASEQAAMSVIVPQQSATPEAASEKHSLVTMCLQAVLKLVAEQAESRAMMTEQAKTVLEQPAMSAAM